MTRKLWTLKYEETLMVNFVDQPQTCLLKLSGPKLGLDSATLGLIDMSKNM